MTLLGIYDTYPYHVPSVPDKLYFYNSIYPTSVEVQLGQRLALIGILVQQKGHSLVVGAAGSATFLGACILAIGPTTKKKTTKAIITKLMIVFMKSISS